MPSHITNEDRWQRAKVKAEEAGHKEEWPYVMSIYLKMNGGKVASLQRIIALHQRTMR